jgi:hypothetical protein
VKGLQGGGAFSHFIKSGRVPSSGCSSKSLGLAVDPPRPAPHCAASRRQEERTLRQYTFYDANENRAGLQRRGGAARGSHRCGVLLGDTGRARLSRPERCAQRQARQQQHSHTRRAGHGVRKTFTHKSEAGQIFTTLRIKNPETWYIMCEQDSLRSLLWGHWWSPLWRSW